MLAVLTFLASGPGGALLGFVMDWMSEKRAAKREAREAERDELIAKYDQTDKFAKQLDKQNPGTLKPISRKFKLGTWTYEKTSYYLFPTNVVTPRARVVAACLFMLVTTYCAIALVFAIDPTWIIHTIDPDADPIKFNFLVFGWEWTPRKPVSLNAGGAAFYMAASLNFIISTAIVGTARKLAR